MGESCRRTSWRSGAIGSTIALSLLTACGVFTSLDGLTDGLATSPATADAAVATRAPDDEGDRDRESAPGSDAEVANEVESGRADSGTWCAGRGGASCTDFDTPATSEGWAQVLTGTGSLSYDGTSARSAPRSLVANITGGTTNQQALLQRSFALQATGRAALAFDFVIDQQPDSGDMKIAEVDMNVGAADAHGLYLRVGVAGTSLVEHAPPTTDGGSWTRSVDVPSVVIPRGTWSRVEIGVDLTAAPTMTYRVDGVLVGSRALAASWKNGTITLVMGIDNIVPPTMPRRVRFDNVVMSR